MKNEIYPKVFTWLFVGLLITFLTGYCLSLNPVVVGNLLSGGSYLILVIVEFAVAIFFSLRLGKMSKATAVVCYILYSFITGLTFSVIFLAFNMASIMTIFIITALVFGIFALIGFTTKKDVTSWSNFLFMALLAVILATIINIFIGSSTLDLIISIVCVIVFIAYIIYDIKKIEMYSSFNSEAGPIFGAFQLYLDFINIFIRLLSIFGKANDN